MPDSTSPRSFFRRRYPSKVDAMTTPQQLSRQAIDEFKAIYKEEFGQDLSDDEAQEIALRLLRFFGILGQPLPGETSAETPARSRDL